MRTIRENIVNEIVIKNSRFITLLIKIDSLDISKILDEVKDEYPKATHYCYGYVFGGVRHFSDDGEPGGTAGMPIINVLEKEKLNNVLCIVVRYFGGIKLGAGGLVRAYTKSVTESLKVADFLYLEEGYKIEVRFDYSMEKNINYILRDATVINKEFRENVSYTVLVPHTLLSKLEEIDYEILEELYIEK